jgi:hypothetical protein
MMELWGHPAEAGSRKMRDALADSGSDQEGFIP